MAYIPQDAKWYLATIIDEISVRGESRNVIHKNYILVRADSPEDAYEKAHELGKRSEVSYKNPEGRSVQIRFRGLGELDVIHDKLEHGAELCYEELVGLLEKQIKALVRAKEDLAVFRPGTPSSGPDYSSQEVIEQARRLIEAKPGSK